MQEIQFKDGKRIQQFYETLDESEMNKDLRSTIAEHGSPTVIKRKKVEGEDPCPCGSGNKFEKCCISKINKLNNALQEMVKAKKALGDA